jgi:hypothetical protein
MHDPDLHTVLFLADAAAFPATVSPASASRCFTAARVEQPPALTSRYGVTAPDFDRVVEFGADALPSARSELAVSGADPARSCVVVGEWTTVFDAPCAYFLYVLMKAAAGLSRADFIERWTSDFVKIVRRTPGQVAYGRLIVDRDRTAERANDLQFVQPDFDAMVLGGFGSEAGLETAVAWANTDNTHAAAVAELFAPNFRKILVTPPNRAPGDRGAGGSLGARLR